MIIQKIENTNLAKVLYEIQEYMLSEEGSVLIETNDILIIRKDDQYDWILLHKSDRDESRIHYQNDLNSVYIELPTTWYTGFNIHEYVAEVILGAVFMTTHWNMAAMGSKGGKRSLTTMTAEERSERAKKAAKKRWEKKG